MQKQPHSNNSSGELLAKVASDGGEGVEESPEETQAREADELKAIQDYAKELEQKYTVRKYYRERNANISEYRPEESDFVKLDSSLKKNTGLVRKLKSFTESQKETLLKEIKSLNLSKYVSEVAGAMVETKLKMSDINAAIEICCLLHEKYAEFSGAMMDSWQKVLLQKKDSKVANPSKYRVDLRLFAELISVGVLSDKTALETLARQLQTLAAMDKEEHNNASIIQSFCKHCGNDYAGLVPRKYRQLSDRYGISLASCPTLPPEKQKGCRQLLKDYYSSIAKQLQRDHRELQYTEWQNRKILHTKGELSQERQERYESMKSAYTKLLANAQTLSDLVDEKMCELIDHKFGNKDDDAEFSSTQEFQYDGDTSLYEDEETQQFYENLLDLRAVLPQILLKDTPKPGSTNNAKDGGESAEGEAKDESDLKVEDIEKELESEKEAADSQSQQDEQTDKEAEDLALADDQDAADNEAPEEGIEMAATSKLLYDKFLQDLQTCVNRELIDRAAQDFVMNHNTKRNRKRLIGVLFSVPRTRYDLLPFYSRFVATLYPCMPDVAAELSKYLLMDFKHLVRKKDQIFIETKLKSVRFIGEMVKFGMFGKNEALHCLKMLLFDFSHHNIDMACAFLETCGRFLYRSPDSHHRTRVYLEVMMKKKTVLSLDSRYNTMIENAFYYSNPPTNQVTLKEVKNPTYEYIKKLLFKDLNKVTTEKVLKQMRKLNWKDESVRDYAVESLIAVWNVKYSNIHCVANLLSGLAPYHEEVAVQVVDGVLEDIRIGMEMNHPKFNQRRLAVVKYLGELYNYRLVDSAVIFKTFYSFITFGVSYDYNAPSILDPPAHLFRLRLTCILLDTCAQYFDRGSGKKKLDYFLVYFQKYYWFKKASPHWDEEYPFPLNIDMVVKDSLEAVRPKEKFVQSYLEAEKNAEKLNEEFKEKLSGVLPFIEQESGDHESAIAENDTDLPTIREQDENMSDSQSQDQQNRQSTEEAETSQTDRSPSKTPSRSQSQDCEEASEGSTSEEDEDDADDLTPPPEQELEFDMKQKGPKLIECQEDEDFMAAFDKMLMENIQQRSQEAVKVSQTDINVPVNYKTQMKKPFVAAKGSMIEEKSENTDGSQPPLKFALMTRKGNKAQFSTLDLDVTKQLAVRYKEREMEERAEKEKLKQLVLEINERQEEEEQAAIEAGKSLLPNVNREKKVKYQHQKGAPDAEAIFGS